MDTLLLKPECVEPLQKIIQNFVKTKKSNGTVTCIFGDHVQFEKLDEMELLPKNLMRIVHNYCDDKMIIDCSPCIVDSEELIAFNINDNNNKITYHYSVHPKMLCIINKTFNQKDDSVLIISSSVDYFNLSRFYCHYAPNDNLTFGAYGGESTCIVHNNKYTITIDCVVYVLSVLDHEILTRRIGVMKQLIDIIRKLLK